MTLPWGELYDGYSSQESSQIPSGIIYLRTGAGSEMVLPYALLLGGFFGQKYTHSIHSFLSAEGDDLPLRFKKEVAILGRISARRDSSNAEN